MALANAALQEIDKSLESVTSLSSDYSSVINTENMPDGLKYYGSSLLLKSKAIIRHYFTYSGNINDITVTLNDTPLEMNW